MRYKKLKHHRYQPFFKKKRLGLHGYNAIRILYGENKCADKERKKAEVTVGSELESIISRGAACGLMDIKS